MVNNSPLPTMEEHADALHPVAPRPDPSAPFGRDAKGRPRAFQDSIAQGTTAPPAPKTPAPGLIDALTPKVRQ
jgi:hypothetical protein